MENKDIVAEIKEYTNLLRASEKDKRGEIEAHLVELYKKRFKENPELLKDIKKIDEKIAAIKGERPTNWVLKVQALESLKNEIDAVVTLLDGTKMRKSQVPNGEIYINEKGQKCRKVLKVIPVQHKPETTDEKRAKKFAQKIKAAVVNGSAQLIKVSKNTFKKIGEKRKRAKASAGAFMDSMMAKLMAKMQIGKTINSLEEYQKSSGTAHGTE